MKAKLAAIAVSAMTLTVVGFSIARADNTPPQKIGTPVLTIVVSANTEGGDKYHQSSGSSHGCATPTKQDGTNDNNDCWNRRADLKNAPGDEGGPADCWRGSSGVTAGPVTWDGAWFNGSPNGGQCTNAIPTEGRIYTGVGVTGVGSGGAAAGGSATGGCVQALGEDDTNGNVIATAANTASGTPNSTDDDADVTVCGGVL